MQSIQGNIQAATKRANFIFENTCKKGGYNKTIFISRTSKKKLYIYMYVHTNFMYVIMYLRCMYVYVCTYLCT